MSEITRRSVVPFLITVAGLLFVPVALSAQDGNVPNPLATTGKFVGDNAGVLGPAYLDLIDAVCVRLRNATGAELAVVTVRDLGGTPPEDFSERLFKRFGIGEKGKDNGLLLLFALDDRAVRFEVGYGLESVITDALAGRLLDDQAMPFFARGEYGRGLFAVAKAAAEAVAGASGVTLGLSDPPVWPEQPRPAAVDTSGKKAPVSAATGKRGHYLPPVVPGILAAVVAGLTGLWILFALRRFGRARSRIQKFVAAGSGIGFLILMWMAAITILIVLLGGKSSAFSILLFGLSPTLSSFLWSATRRRMRERAASYRLPCSSCGSPMDLIPDDVDDAQLSVPEAAEEKAGGMDYEVWTCPQCRAREMFAVTHSKASACPSCHRRTLVRTHEVLEAATTTHGGRERITDECRNPECGYAKTWERETARIVPAPVSSGSSGSGGSSLHGSSGSSRSSFGGGRSGGGGATRRF